jgi:hypothetical protein
MLSPCHFDAAAFHDAAMLPMPHGLPRRAQCCHYYYYRFFC